MFWRKPVPADAGPLYPEVLAAMKGVQAYAQSHGGRIELVTVTPEGDVHLRLKGTCAGCPLATVTLKLGVERALRAQVPAVRKVVRL